MYRALYRKWRPLTFDDVTGQPHVTDTLSHEVATGKLSHAYLFTGSRGTGKTTCAKILSKAVNCLSPVNGSPCNECEICKGIDSGAVLDVIEIDAASNNGVDNIRDLREEATFTPVKAKFRVYIIDEVHMLSIGAFNALLKILEEPPSYVVFILATTEVHKLPATILSRCQRFDFHHIPPEDISKRLMYVAKQENLTLSAESAMMIARYADGALRDALSLLDSCSAKTDNITPDIVSSCAGIAGKNHLFKMADFISAKDTSSAINLVSDLHNSSCNMERLCIELMEHFRNLMISKTVNNVENLIIAANEDIEHYKKQSSQFSLEAILNILTVLSNAVNDFKKGIDRKLQAEMLIVRLCTPSLSSDNSSILRRIADLESGIHINRPSVTVSQPIVEKEAETPVKTETQKEKIQTSDSDELTRFKSWPEVLGILKETCKPVSGLLSGSSAYTQGSKLFIKTDNAALVQFLNIPLYSNAIIDAVIKSCGQKYSVSVYNNDTEKKRTDPLENLVKKIDEYKKERE
ncbi:MAG: DNA polymerase III subunit gamma/tau [Clostridia bacterium]|nr:DNA polymerase III subunit gamma/tau [Clostridia bacterium]